MAYTGISRSTDIDKMFLVRPLTVQDLRIADLSKFYAELDLLLQPEIQNDIGDTDSENGDTQSDG